MNISIEIKAPELANSILALANALSGKVNGPITLDGAQLAKVVADQQPAQQQAPQQQPPVPQQQQPTLQAVPLSQPQQQPPVQQVPQQAPQQPVQQQQAPQGVPQQAPQQPVQQQQAPQGVPTSAPSYTMDQLAVAATQLVDAGKREDLVQLLSTFSVQSLTALPKEQYGAFATKLREMGAKI